MSNIVIGKHTLESLTSGMYSDPYVVFREYVQNAADSIDEAIKTGVLQSGEDQISICLSPAERRISICDNGLGIPSIIAEKTLISIGNSKKTSDNSRGFRGIGRLSALSYCTKLTFETSTRTEKCGTRVTFDAKRLAELLISEEYNGVSVTEVLRNVYSIEIFPEKEDTHYFNVYMDGVDDTSMLNDIDGITAYISQNAPVPYDPVSFVWGKEISRRLAQEGLIIEHYNIFVTYGNRSIPIYKPYKDEFLVDKGKNLTDRIIDIELIKLTQQNGSIAAIGWIAKTSYLGSIYDKSIKGVRIRKGNILIGDNQTLNVIFKDARFNGWSIGEIFAIDSKLIPNSRRDNFEKNPAYFLLVEQLTTVASEITKEIRNASLKRNSELSNALKQSVLARKTASEAIEAGINSTKKGVIKQRLAKAQTVLENTLLHNDADAYCKKIAFEELDMLIGNLQGVTSFKSINTINNLSKTEKKILEQVFNVIIAVDADNANTIIDAILVEFTSKSAIAE